MEWPGFLLRCLFTCHCWCNNSGCRATQKVTQLNPLRMLSCSANKYICHSSRVMVVGLGHGPRDASDDWNIVDVNVRWQELSAFLLSARASGISKAIGLRASQHSQMWGSPQGLVKPRGGWNDAFCSYNDHSLFSLKVLFGVSCSSPAVPAS